MRLFLLAILFICGGHLIAQTLKQDQQADLKLIKEKITLVRSEVDSMDGRAMQTADTAKIIYSPDKRFKIVYTVGESCGAYCNPYNMGWLYLSTKNKVIEKQLDFCDPVDAIHILQKTKMYTDYLIMMSNWSRPRGFETGLVWNFIQLRVYTDKYEIIQPELKDGTDSYYGVFSSNVICKEEKKSGMWFDKKGTSISYLTYEYRDENSNCVMVSGKYVFKAGKFIQTEAKTAPAKTSTD